MPTTRRVEREGQVPEDLVLTLVSSAPAHTGARTRRWAWAEVRADLGVPEHAAEVAERSIFALRSEAAGGRGPNDGASRHSQLRAAAERHARVELEVERDLEPELLAAIAPAQRVLAWYGASASVPTLRDTLAGMRSVEAAAYKVVTHAGTIPEAVAPLALLPGSPGDVVAYDRSPSGSFTRMLARALGSALTPVALDDGAAVEPSQPGLDRVLRDYGHRPSRPTELYGIVGRSLVRSMSPRLHNGAYRRRGVAAIYLPFEHEGPSLCWVSELAVALRAATSVTLRGLTVTAPFKEAALALAGEARCTAEARACGAVNVLTAGEEPGEWYGDTTDGVGIRRPLRERGIAVEGRACAVIGCGGAGRAAAVALRDLGAHVTLFNRSEDRGRSVAEQLGIAFESLPTLRPARHELLVHATPLGKHDDDGSPFDVSDLRPGATLIDFVYRASRPTSLVAAARARGVHTIDGWAVLAAEVDRQLVVLTGSEGSPIDPAWLEAAALRHA